MANGDGSGDPLNFGEWLDRFEHDQDNQNAQIGKLTENLGSLTGDIGKLAATVQALVDNQKGLFNRANRPVQWGAIIGGMTMLGVMAGLLVSPIKENQVQQREFNMHVMHQIEDDAREMGEAIKDIEWLNKMEDRLNRRIHSERN